jgi:hypothetical protein
MWDTHWRDKLHDPIPGRKLTINVFIWQKLLTIDKKLEKCESHVWWCCYTPLIANWASGLSSGAVNFVNSVRQSGNKPLYRYSSTSILRTVSTLTVINPHSHSPIAEDFAPRIPRSEGGLYMAKTRKS